MWSSGVDDPVRMQTLGVHQHTLQYLITRIQAKLCINSIDAYKNGLFFQQSLNNLLSLGGSAPDPRHVTHLLIRTF